jgi:hypothetical protein
LCPDQRAGEGNIEPRAVSLQGMSRAVRFLDAALGEIGITPASKQIALIPFTLTVTNENENEFAYLPLWMLRSL